MADGEKMAGLQSEGTASPADWLGEDLIFGWTIGHYQIADRITQGDHLDWSCSLIQ